MSDAPRMAQDTAENPPPLAHLGTSDVRQRCPLCGKAASASSWACPECQTARLARMDKLDRAPLNPEAQEEITERRRHEQRGRLL